MALLEVRTEWAVYKNCFLQVAKYQADNSRAIEIWNEEDGPYSTYHGMYYWKYAGGGRSGA